ncbi:hypothetical protein, partial [Bifidobacterium asteroides]|uniref:hypothetical protein n=1 Tax=Bifidobacterium asteroides TaxID=1684 RepID=UPI0019D3452D
SLPTASENEPVFELLIWLNLIPFVLVGGVMVVLSPPIWLPVSGLIVHLFDDQWAVSLRSLVTGLLKS